jgi:two-component system, response regulator PdtaR
MEDVKKIRVFIAEDEAIILASFKMILKRNGYEVIGEATSGLEAYKKICELKPDLILMDINMPELDGVNILIKINKIMVIPCIFITGQYSAELVERVNNAGAFGYLIKPVDERQIKASIDIAMERYREFKLLNSETNNLKAALESRKYIERAKGILVQKCSMNEQDAMKHLQKKSRNANIKLVDVAKEIIKADELFRA